MTKLELLKQDLDAATKAWSAFAKKHREDEDNRDDICYEKLGERPMEVRYINYTPEEEKEADELLVRMRAARDLFMEEKKRLGLPTHAKLPTREL